MLRPLPSPQVILCHLPPEDRAAGFPWQCWNEGSADSGDSVQSLPRGHTGTGWGGEEQAVVVYSPSSSLSRASSPFSKGCSSHRAKVTHPGLVFCLPSNLGGMEPLPRAAACLCPKGHWAGPHVWPPAGLARLGHFYNLGSLIYSPGLASASFLLRGTKGRSWNYLHITSSPKEMLPPICSGAQAPSCVSVLALDENICFHCFSPPGPHPPPPVTN